MRTKGSPSCGGFEGITLHWSVARPTSSSWTARPRFPELCPLGDDAYARNARLLCAGVLGPLRVGTCVCYALSRPSSRSQRRASPWCCRSVRSKNGETARQNQPDVCDQTNFVLMHQMAHPDGRRKEMKESCWQKGMSSEPKDPTFITKDHQHDPPAGVSLQCVPPQSTWQQRGHICALPHVRHVPLATQVIQQSHVVKQKQQGGRGRRRMGRQMPVG